MPRAAEVTFEMRHGRLVEISRKAALLFGDRRQKIRPAIARGALERTIEVSANLLQRDAGFEPSNDLHPPGCRLLQTGAADLAIECHRNSQVRRFIGQVLDSSELGSCYPHNSDDQLAYGDGLTHRRRVSTEPLSPVRITEYRNRSRSVGVVFRREKASDLRLNVQDLKIVPGDHERRGRQLGLTVVHNIGATDWRQRGNSGERLIGVDERLIDRIRNGFLNVLPGRVTGRRPIAAPAAHHLVLAGPANPDEPFGFRNADRSKQQTIDAAEQRRIGANPQRQRQQDNRSPSLCLKQLANGKFQVLKHRSPRGIDALITLIVGRSVRKFSYIPVLSPLDILEEFGDTPLDI
jgi:hypothetical protein